MKRLSLVLFALVALAGFASAQCRNGGCSSGGCGQGMSSCGAGGCGQSSQYLNVIATKPCVPGQIVKLSNTPPNAKGEINHNGLYARFDGVGFVACSATGGACTCGPNCPCDANGNCIDPANCPNGVCPLPKVKSIPTADLTEATAPEGSGFYKDKNGNIYCLERKAVKESVSVTPK